MALGGATLSRLPLSLGDRVSRQRQTLALGPGFRRGDERKKRADSGAAPTILSCSSRHPGEACGSVWLSRNASFAFHPRRRKDPICTAYLAQSRDGRTNPSHCYPGPLPALERARSSLVKAGGVDDVIDNPRRFAELIGKPASEP
jgi:hypothetical protein